MLHEVIKQPPSALSRNSSKIEVLPDFSKMNLTEKM